MTQSEPRARPEAPFRLESSRFQLDLSENARESLHRETFDLDVHLLWFRDQTLPARLDLLEYDLDSAGQAHFANDTEKTSPDANHRPNVVKELARTHLIVLDRLD